jgi:hypothetical protein
MIFAQAAIAGSFGCCLLLAERNRQVAVDYRNGVFVLSRPDKQKDRLTRLTRNKSQPRHVVVWDQPRNLHGGLQIDELVPYPPGRN